MDRFSSAFDLERKRVAVDPLRFQGRQGEFAEDTVNAIVNKGKYDRNADEIIVWRDPSNENYYVISGHSRWEAARQLFESGKQPDLITIPVKEYEGDEEDAIDFATIESNRGSTEEGLKSDLEAYRRAVSRGFNTKRLMAAFKPKTRLFKLRDLSFLNPKGPFTQYLGTESEKHFPYIERNARWVGVLRDQMPLTNEHEQEIFNFFYKENEAGQKLSKDQFFKIINDKVNRIDFDADAPLNLKNRVSSNALTDPITEQIKDLDRQIEKLNREAGQKRESIARAKSEGLIDVVPKLQSRISDINKITLRLTEEKQALKQKSGRIEASAVDLFSDPTPAPKKTPDPIQQERVKKVVKKVIKRKGQYNINKEIEQLVATKKKNGEAWTRKEIDFALTFSGAGGVETGSRGSLYEYYTPDAIIARMWHMVQSHGFSTGNILEPSVGTGKFLRYVDPSNCYVDAYEYSKDDDTSFEICKAAFPWINIKNDYFESIFYEGNKRIGTAEKYDLVIGNPPYGKFSGKYAGKAREGRLFNGRTYDQYFIWAGIQLLKKGGLLSMIIPSTFMDNGSSYEAFKDELYAQADLLEAYRLPRNVFEFTQVQTDILVFKKR
jgi:hypothetical protein